LVREGSLAPLYSVGFSFLRFGSYTRLVVKRSSANLVATRWLTDNDDIAAGCEAVLAINLLLTTALSGRACPDIDVFLSGTVVNNKSFRTPQGPEPRQ
jgi:hypothetical protein